MITKKKAQKKGLCRSIVSYWSLVVSCLLAAGECRPLSSVDWLAAIDFYWQASATPLQRAAAEGHVDIVQQLLKHGADVNHQDSLVPTTYCYYYCSYFYYLY